MNLQLNWPSASVLVALIASVTLLGVHGDLPVTWLQHTLSAVVGILLGIPLGRLRSSAPAAAAEPAVAATRSPRE